MISHNCQVEFCDDLLIVMCDSYTVGTLESPQSLGSQTVRFLFFLKKGEKNLHAFKQQKKIYIYHILRLCLKMIVH